MQHEIRKVDASVNENSLHAALLINAVVYLLFERIANDHVNDTQVYSLFAVFICQCFINILFANVNAPLTI